MSRKKEIYLKTGICIIGFLLVISFISLFWTPYSPTKMNALLKNAAPSMSHIFGCDNYGRDVFSRVMSGLFITFIIAVCTVMIGCIIGTVIVLFLTH